MLEQLDSLVSENLLIVGGAAVACLGVKMGIWAYWKLRYVLDERAASREYYDRYN
jgi:hypothetical protein